MMIRPARRFRIGNAGDGTMLTVAPDDWMLINLVAGEVAESGRCDEVTVKVRIEPKRKSTPTDRSS